MYEKKYCCAVPDKKEKKKSIVNAINAKYVLYND